jgi:SET domain-containing protein
MCIYSAENSMIGTSLDIVGSLMNHSCDPNSFVFHEGSELRVRSLKHIEASEEITQCYADVDMDVLFRRNGLEEENFFTCECKQYEWSLHCIIPDKLL